MKEIKDDWLLQRVESIYPLFKNGISEIFRIPPNVTAVTRMINDEEQTIKLQYTLNGDEKHKAGYNVSFINGTLYIQRLLATNSL